jgi:hypothetical protein
MNTTVGRTGFLEANLLKEHPDDRFEKTSPTSTFQIEIDAGSAKNWEALALMYTNATTSATWRVRTATTLPVASNVLEELGTTTLWAATDSGDVTDRHALWINANGATSARYILIDITDTGTPGGDDIFRAGRLVACSDGVFNNRNITFSSDHISLVDRSTFTTTSRGRRMVTRGHTALRRRIRIRTDSKADIEALADAFQSRGGSRDLLAVLDSSQTTRWDLGQMLVWADTSIRIREDAPGFYTVDLPLEER